METLRTAFATQLGDEQYRKFIFELDGCRARRQLRYWMQEAWDTFVTKHPEWAMTFDELLVIFRVCRVHRCDLTPATVRLVATPIQYSDSYHSAWSRLFPHSYPHLPDNCPTRMFDTFLCPECQKARAEWEQTNTPS